MAFEVRCAMSSDGPNILSGQHKPDDHKILEAREALSLCQTGCAARCVPEHATRNLRIKRRVV